MPKTFYIIDGHAQIYRAYFAPFRELTSASGEPTKATFVFTQRLLNLIQDRKPDYLAMVIDSGDETVFRKQIYPQYKANRPSRPEDFLPQERRILQIVKDAGIPIYARPGFEADDLIATIARRLCNQGWDIIIVSNDKDLRQLLNDCTRMYDVYKDVFTDVAAMQQTLGYLPSQAIEVQTLIGDPTDNVPGIPGVGEKTAVKLIRQFGSADAVLEHLDELTPKMRENFQANAHVLALSRQLVTLKNDVPFDFDPEACRFQGVNAEALKGHFRALGFANLLKRLEDADPQLPRRALPARKPSGDDAEQGLFGAMGSEPTGGSPASGDALPQAGPLPSTCADCQYTLIDTEEKFVAFLAELTAQKRFAFDTETDALGAMNSTCIGLSFSWKHGTGYYVPTCGPKNSQHLSLQRVLPALKPILEDPSIKKVGHNIKYDLLVMRQAGITLRGIEMDSMVAAFLLDASRTSYGIDRLAYDLLNFQKIPTTDLIGKGKSQISMSQTPLDKVATYASEDADISLRLCDLLSAKLDAAPALRKLNDEIETPLINVLAEMEFNGVAVDPAILKEQSEALAVRVEELRREIFKSACVEFNIDSPKQLQDVLFNKLGLQIVKRTKTGLSTDVEVLEKLADRHSCPRLILDYRTLVKLKNTYLDNLTDYLNPRTRRIHGSFNQTGAATGRLSMSDPNLQNIPIRTDEGRRIRLAFVAADPETNVLLTADYSQIELRILAHYTKEPALVKAFEADEDIHRAVASEVFNTPLQDVTRQQRNYAKTINFGIIYGVSAYGLARRIEGLTLQAAQELIIAYNKRFPTIARFLDQCVMEARTNGFVETILGRRRRLPDIDSGVIAQRNAAERMAINSVVQGSAADLIKVAMNRIYARLKSEKRPSKMLLQVHDELVFETPKEAIESDSAMIRQEMTDAMKLAVPLKVEVGYGRNWQEGK